jgi:hypothetical protein
MNKNLFRWLSVLTGLLYLSLFYQMLFTPEQILKSFGVLAETHIIYLTQRTSVLMLGFAVLVLLSCNLPSSKARGVFATAVAVNMAGFACNSFWGAAQGILTDPAIPYIGTIETVIAALYAAFAVSDFAKLRKAASAP